MTLSPILVSFLIAASASVWAQVPGSSTPGKVIGRVMEASSGLPVEFVTVTILKSSDSTLAGGGLTGPDGRFDAAVPFGKFIVRVELMSYEDQTLSTLVTPQAMIADLGDIKLELSATELEGVTVEGERSQVQIALDKKVFNVEKDLAAAGGSALDALENVPSVTVDMDGNVALRGSQGVRILIDGKPSSLIGISGSQGLQNLPANSIESIEIISNPSARYEAEGMSGIINIVMKKQKKPGLNGLFSLGAGYPHNYSASANLNYGLKKVNLFTSYSGSYRQNPGAGTNHRVTTINDTTTVFDTKSTYDWGGWNHNARMGADWTINPNNTLTTAGGFSISSRANPRTVDYTFYDHDNILQTHYDRVSSIPEVFPNKNVDGSVLYKHLFKGRDHFFSIDFSYNGGHQQEVSQITETYYLENYAEATTPVTTEQSTSTDNQDNLIAKADFSRPIGESGKLEIGYRGGFSEIDRDYFLERHDDSSDAWVYDSSVSNHFIYNEQVHAGYLIYGGKVKKLSYQFGLRVENTNVEGLLEETNESFTKKYNNVFPSVHLGRSMGKGHTLQVSYSRRIQRPSFWNLNPFMSHADPYNLWAGNPNLNPELTHSIELGDIWYGKVTTISSSIYYRHTDSLITRIRSIDAEGVATTLPMNLNTSDAIGFELTLSTTLAKWWKLNGSLNLYQQTIDGSNIDSAYTASFFSYSARIMSMLNLWKGSTFQVMANYRGPEESPQGVRLPMVFFDIGLKQDVLKGKGNLTLKVIDPFNTHRFRFRTIGENYTIDTNFQRQARGFVLNFTYKLNNFRQRERQGGENYQMEEIGF